MADRRFVTSAILVASLAALVSCQLAPPKLLDPDNPSARQLHIQSEVIDSDGGHRLAEELVDLDSGKAVYMDTKDHVRSIWLIEVNEQSMFKYQPYSCETYQLDALDGVTLPPEHQTLVKPSIRMPNERLMNLFGISAVLQYFSEFPYYQYSQLTDSDGVSTGHSWSLTNVNLGHTVKLSFSEQTDALGALLLESIEIIENSNKQTIKILSINRHISSEDHRKLDLPLIYGCKRNRLIDIGLRQVFSFVDSNQTSRFNLKAQARAISFAANGQPETSEEQNIELAISELKLNNTQKGRMLMIKQQNSLRNSKMLIDYNLGVKLDANMKSGKCEISRIHPSQPEVLRFSDKLNLSLDTFESLFYGVTTRSLMKVEQREQGQLAYFAEDLPDMFGPKKLGRVVKRFSLDANLSPRLDSVAIWVFAEAANQQDGSSLTIQETYEFDFSDNKLIETDVDNAEAFDISQECYIQNEQMIHGRDYAWVNIGYQMDRVHELWASTDYLKGIFYNYIQSILGLNYLRVPKMEIIFGESSFTVKLLVLDVLDPHLVYNQRDSYALDVKSDGIPARSVEECSKLCKKIRCTTMSFLKTSFLAGTCKMATYHVGMLKLRHGAVTYVSRPDERKLPSLKELGIDKQIELVWPIDDDEIRQMFGYEDYYLSQRSEVSTRFRQFSSQIMLTDTSSESIDLKPSSLRVDFNSQ